VDPAGYGGYGTWWVLVFPSYRVLELLSNACCGRGEARPGGGCLLDVAKSDVVEACRKIQAPGTVASEDEDGAK
jgi:hypothetical protein